MAIDEGHWITLENGVHVLIKDGQSVEEALAQKFDNDDDLDFDSDNSMSEPYKNLARTDFKGKIKIQKNSFTSTKEWFLRAFDNKYNDEELDNVITNFFNTRKNFKIKLKNTNSGRCSHFKPYGDMIVIDTDYSPDKMDILNTFYHEMGHAIDFDPASNNYKSNTYVSSRYNSTLRDMLDEEFKENLDEDTIKEIRKSIIDKMNKLKRDTDEELDEYNNLTDILASFGDLVQNVFGNDVCQRCCNGYLGHNDIMHMGKQIHYFEYKKFKGTECFAELCSNLASDKNRHLINIFQQYAPKTLDIFYEILGGMKKNG